MGTVAVVDSGMAAAGMAAMVRHSYYLRLYIFYLEGGKGGAKGREGSQGEEGKRRCCMRHALLTHIFPYLYFIYSTQIEDEKSSFQTKINCVCSLCNLLINYKYNLFFTKRVDLRNHAL